MSAIPIGIPGWPEFAFCTASMASARSALASSCRLTIGLLPARQLDTELFEFAIQVGALQSHALGHPAHVRGLTADVVFEIHAFESVARFAQRQVQRQRTQR